MRTLLLLLFAVGLVAGTPALAVTPAFDTPAISDAELSLQHGMAAPSTFSQLRRTMAETNAREYFRTTADINQSTFDNWFANEGAALITTNLIRELSDSAVLRAGH